MTWASFHARYQGSAGALSIFSADTVSVSCEVPNRAFASVSASTRNSDNVSPPPETVGLEAGYAEASGHEGAKRVHRQAQCISCLIRARSEARTWMSTYTAIFANREFRNLWIGSALGNAASTMTSLTLAIMVDATTGSALLAAMIMFGPSLAQVLGVSTLMSAADTARPRRVLTLLAGLSTVAVCAQAALDLVRGTPAPARARGRLRTVDRLRRPLGPARRGGRRGPVHPRPLGDEPVRRRDADRRLRHRRTVAAGNQSVGGALDGDRLLRPDRSGAPVRAARPRAPASRADRPRPRPGAATAACSARRAPARCSWHCPSPTA